MKRKLSLAAVLAALVVALSVVFTACGNTATDTAAPADGTATEAVTEAATEAATEATTEVATETPTEEEVPKEEVAFKLEIEPGDAGDAETLDCTASGTLGDYLRDLEGCDWEESQYGIFVTGFNGIANDDASGSYWMLYVDGESSMVGADEVNLEEGATYTWKYETFE